MQLSAYSSVNIEPTINEDGSLTVTLATTDPCINQKTGQIEVWDLKSFDLSRGPYGIGVYAEHNYAAETLGIADNLRLDPTGNKLLADVKFRSDARSQAYRQDVLNKTVRGISAGIQKTLSASVRRLAGRAGAPDTYVLSGFQPYDCTVTNIPCDIRSGFGSQRSIEGSNSIEIEDSEVLMDKEEALEPETQRTCQTQEEKTCEKRSEDPKAEEENEPKTEVESQEPVPENQEPAAEEATETPEEEAKEVETDPNKPRSAASDDFFNGSRSVTASISIETSPSTGENMLQGDAPLSVVQTDAGNNYNMARVLRSLASGQALTGAEAEFQQESAGRYGSLLHGVYLNLQGLRTNTTDGANSTTSVSQLILPQDGGVFGYLFPNSIFAQLGVKTRKAAGPTHTAYQTGVPTVGNIAEASATGTAASDLTYTERTIKLVKATAKVRISDEALTDTNVGNIMADIQTSLKEQVRVQVESDLFGYNAAPSALQNQFGLYQAGTKVKWNAIKTTPVAGDWALTTADGVKGIDALVQTIEDFNVGLDGVTYLVTPTQYNALKYLPFNSTNTAKTLLQDGILAENAPVLKVPKSLMRNAALVSGDKDPASGSTISAVKKGGFTLYELSAPVIEAVRDEASVSAGISVFHISYRYAVVLDRPEFGTFLNVGI